MVKLLIKLVLAAVLEGVRSMVMIYVIWSMHNKDTNMDEAGISKKQVAIFDTGETGWLSRGTVASLAVSLTGKGHLTLPPLAIPASPPPKQDLKPAKKGNFFNDYSFLSFVLWWVVGRVCGVGRHSQSAHRDYCS
jgi:hypothetical protein